MDLMVPMVTLLPIWKKWNNFFLLNRCSLRMSANCNGFFRKNHKNLRLFVSTAYRKDTFDLNLFRYKKALNACTLIKHCGR